MASVHDILSERFRRWEQRGRGWKVYNDPVTPEPAFVPYFHSYTPNKPVADDGKRPTFLSGLMQNLSHGLRTDLTPPPIIEEAKDPEPDLLRRDSPLEFQALLPAEFKIAKGQFDQFLLSLNLCQKPIAFELIGSFENVTLQFAVDPGDARSVGRQFAAHLPEVQFQLKDEALEDLWEACDGEEAMVIEFGLEREFMLSLAPGAVDPFVGIIGALSDLAEHEIAVFQVLFEPVRNNWGENILRSVSHEDGRPFFVNQPELTKAAEKKIARPLFAAVVRIAMKSNDYARIVEIAHDLAGALTVFANPEGNELIPLENDGYPLEKHAVDVYRRQTRRSGMLLNLDELLGFVHLPSVEVRSPILERDTGKSKGAPAIVQTGHGLFLGDNLHLGKSTPVYLSPEQRVRHTHVIGIHGTGKSTLLFNLIRQDIEKGQGVAVLDPHGDLIEQVLGIIPPTRIDDVVLVDPSDEEFSVGFNILLAHSDLERNLLASDLVSVFRRLSTTWGDQMGSVLQNAILAFLDSSQGGTLADLRRFLLEPSFREQFLKTVRDSEIVYYWRKGFTQLAGNKSIGSVITRLNDFLAPKPIRHMVSQQKNRLDFADILDTGKIFLAKLSQGQIGRENSYLLGSLLVAKFQQLAMSRQAQGAAQRRYFTLFVDECQHFTTPSMTELLSGVRKYRLGLVLAHQELRQLERDREFASALLSNPYTRIIFRVGDSDARALQDGLSHFQSRDLQNLEVGQAICRVERADNDFNISIPFPKPVDPGVASVTRDSVVAASRAKYASRRKDIEDELLTRLGDIVEDAPEPKVKKSKVAPPETPKPLQSQPVTASAEEVIATSPVKKPEPPPVIRVPTINDLGRGGEQHKAIQKRIKAAAEALGYCSSIEKEVLEGAGSVDLLLEREDGILACEISITTTVDHEVGNVSKCLKAGYGKIIVICIDDDRLAKIEAAVIGSLGPESGQKVQYYKPDAFIEYLESIRRPEPTPEAPKKRRGRNVRRLMSTDPAPPKSNLIPTLAAAMKRMNS